MYTFGTKIKKIIDYEVINNNNEKYITFDTVKIKCDYKCLINKHIKYNKVYNNKTGELISEYFNSKDDSQIPYNLYIAISYTHKTLTLEFSSKVLLQDYPKLISKHTIYNSLENISKLGICELDIDRILNTGCFTRLDVTTDKNLQLTESVLNVLNSSVKNYKRFNWTHYENDGITFQKDVKSRDCKECITLYNKQKELMNNTRNGLFLKLLPNSNDIYDYFKDKTRFEITLSTQSKIKEYLNIIDTKITTVLNCVSNPLLYQFERIFGSSEKQEYEHEFNEYDELCMSLLIKSCDNDMKLVEQKIRNMFSRTGYSKRKKKLDAVYERMKINGDSSNGVIEQIRNLLLE